MGKNGCGCSGGGSRSKCGCGGREMLSIPKGNDFRLQICGGVLVPGMKDRDVDFREVEGLTVYLASWLGRKQEVPYELDSEGKDFLLTVAADVQKCTVYGVEMTGTYQGKQWRWKAGELFRIVDTNCQSSVQPGETYSVETYWVMDSLEVDVVDDTMIFTTHGHADIKDETLILQDAGNMAVTVEDGVLVFQER